MRVLVIGGTGMVGSALVHVLSAYGHEVLAPTRGEYDISSGPLPVKFFRGMDAVVNAAVVKPAPVNLRTAMRVNVEFPRVLARECSPVGVGLIHLSTDAVFSGRAGPYDEASVPDPDDEYGVQKLAGEPPFGLVIRTSVIGPERRGFNSLLCWFLAQQGEVPGYVNQFWNGVTSLALARCVATLIAQGTIPCGVRHVFGENINKHDLLLRLARVFGRRIEVTPFQAPVGRDRRLRTQHPEFLAACALPPLDAQLEELVRVADARGVWRSLV